MGIAIVSGSSGSALASGLTKSKPVVDAEGVDDEAERDEAKTSGSSAAPIPIAGSKAKKRGVDYKCESCSKVRAYFLFALSFFVSVSILHWVFCLCLCAPPGCHGLSLLVKFRGF